MRRENRSSRSTAAAAFPRIRSLRDLVRGRPTAAARSDGERSRTCAAGRELEPSRTFVDSLQLLFLAWSRSPGPGVFDARAARQRVGAFGARARSGPRAGPMPARARTRAPGRRDLRSALRARSPDGGAINLKCVTRLAHVGQCRGQPPADLSALRLLADARRLRRSAMVFNRQIEQRVGVSRLAGSNGEACRVEKRWPPANAAWRGDASCATPVGGEGSTAIPSGGYPRVRFRRFDIEDATVVASR